MLGKKDGCELLKEELPLLTFIILMKHYFGGVDAVTLQGSLRTLNKVTGVSYGALDRTAIVKMKL